MNRVISIESIKVACKNCSLGSLCLPMGLTPPDVEKLEKIIKRNRPLHRNDHLFRETDAFSSLYVVKTGTIKTYLPREDGGEQVLGFHLPGEVIGLDAIQDERHACSAKVLETSAVCELPFGQLEELAQVIPSLQHQLFRLLSKEIAEEGKMLTLLGKKNAEERLASFLMSLSCRFKRRGFSPTDFYLSMSRNEIGNYLGLAVETVSRLFTRFQEEAMVRVDRKHIELLDQDRLESVARGSLCSRGNESNSM
ncbi:MAG: fumarate/nitrate reduction transcriptional regulator Fnr [Gammaproteobacteria bacterium]|nr:fumarate/nitrate reduction transcriptional regulator Fnr [Gammaproteobacteria bacterium]MBU1655648.1 fumarate/nitrate reduction transcriptional regulator Fnr [Gammaproteobacteria bacterium]MBU1960301.1 fumarate/nitrate reduction transcriptional regulator Fnr [Gammaproteobacteria bacterium]